MGGQYTSPTLESNTISTIMGCSDISLNFSDVTHFLVQEISLKREGS